MHSKSVNRRAFSREGGQVVNDLKLACMTDGANGCSLRAGQSANLTGRVG